MSTYLDNFTIRYREKKRAERLAENDGHLFAKINCAYCEKEFYPNSSKHIYCCAECKDKAKAERIAKKRYEEKATTDLSKRIVCGAARRSGRVTDRNAFARPNVKNKTVIKNSLHTTIAIKN